MLKMKSAKVLGQTDQNSHIFFDFLDPRRHSLYIFVGNKFSTNNRYLEFQVLI